MLPARLRPERHPRSSRRPFSLAFLPFPMLLVCGPDALAFSCHVLPPPVRNSGRFPHGPVRAACAGRCLLRSSNWLGRTCAPPLRDGHAGRVSQASCLPAGSADTTYSVMPLHRRAPNLKKASITRRSGELDNGGVKKCRFSMIIQSHDMSRRNIARDILLNVMRMHRHSHE